MRKHALALLLFAAWPLTGCGQIPQPQGGEARPTAEVEGSAADPDADPERDEGPDQGDGAEAPARGGSGAGQTEEAYPGEAETPAPDAQALSAPQPGGGEADMLSAQEVSRAEQLALGGGEMGAFTTDAADRDELSEAAAEGDADAIRPVAERPNYRVLYTQRLAQEKGETARAAEVMVYRYDLGEAQRTKVDLGTGEVEALDVPEGFPVPLVPEETLEASAVARADARVRAALEAAGLDPEGAKANGILTRAMEDGAVCAAARCVRLFFSTERSPMPTFDVVVNLDDLTVVEVTQFPGLEAQP